jgi:hypothetical protein
MHFQYHVSAATVHMEKELTSGRGLGTSTAGAGSGEVGGGGKGGAT